MTHDDRICATCDSQYRKYVRSEFHVRPRWQEWLDELWHQCGLFLVFVGACLLIAQTWGGRGA